jgi:integrase
MSNVSVAEVVFHPQYTPLKVKEPLPALQVTGSSLWSHFHRWMETGIGKQWAQRTYKIRRTSIGPFLNWIGDAVVSPEALDEYIALLSEVYAPKSVNVKRGELATFFNWLVKEGEAPYNPLHHLKTKYYPQRFVKTRLTPESYRLIKKKMEEEDSVFLGLIVIGYNTGLRRSDMLALTWDKVDFAGMRIELIPIKTKRFNKKAIIPIVPGSDLAGILLKLKAEDNPSPYVLHRLNTTHREWDVNIALNEQVRRMAPGLSFTVHDLRRSFITNMISSGVAPQVVCSVASVSMRHLLHYWVPNEEAHRMAMAKYHLFLSPPQKVSLNDK